MQTELFLLFLFIILSYFKKYGTKVASNEPLIYGVGWKCENLVLGWDFILSGYRDVQPNRNYILFRRLRHLLMIWSVLSVWWKKHKQKHRSCWVNYLNYLISKEKNIQEFKYDANSFSMRVEFAFAQRVMSWQRRYKQNLIYKQFIYKEWRRPL